MDYTLFSRSNCPLCEAMEDELRPLIDEFNIVVERRYIDNEPALEALYGDKVPVLSRDGEILCHYFLDAEVLKQSIHDSQKHGSQ